MRAPFLISGLPRSRTAWLARAATIDGVSVCEHEPASRMSGLEDLQRYYFERQGAAEYVGISDPTLSAMLPVILDFLPMRTLVVLRDPQEVINSLLAMGRDPKNVTLGVKGINAVQGHPLVYGIRFNELGNSYKVKKALEWLMPGTKVSRRAIEALQSKRISIDHRAEWVARSAVH